MSRQASKAGAIVCVWMNVDRRYDEELHAWYETEHVPEILALDDFLSGRRYYADESPLRYLALYETVDEGSAGAPGFQGIVARPTPWTSRIRALFGEQRRRSNFKLLLDAGPGAETNSSPRAIVTVDLEGPADMAAGAMRLEALEGCSRYRAYADVTKPSLGFEIHDFDDIDAARAAAAALQRPGRVVELRIAVGTPRVK